MASETSGLLIYDGECQFCCASIAWLRARGRLDGIDTVSYQFIGGDVLSRRRVSRAECRAYVVLCKDGAVFRGGNAVLELAATTCPAARLLKNTRLAQASAGLLYRAIAANRGAISRALRAVNILKDVDYCSILARH